MKQTFRDYAYSAFHLACRGDGDIDAAEVRAVLSSLAELGDAWEMRPTKALEEALDVSKEYLADRHLRRQDELDALLTQRLSKVGEALDQDTLQRLYAALKGVAAADGAIAQGEKQLLDRIRQQWNVAPR